MKILIAGNIFCLLSLLNSKISLLLFVSYQILSALRLKFDWFENKYSCCCHSVVILRVYKEVILTCYFLNVNFLATLQIWRLFSFSLIDFIDSRIYHGYLHFSNIPTEVLIVVSNTVIILNTFLADTICRCVLFLNQELQ